MFRLDLSRNYNDIKSETKDVVNFLSHCWPDLDDCVVFDFTIYYIGIGET